MDSSPYDHQIYCSFEQPVHLYLIENFPDRWPIGSPDLSPLDFCGYLKNKICKTQAHN